MNAAKLRQRDAHTLVIMCQMLRPLLCVAAALAALISSTGPVVGQDSPNFNPSPSGFVADVVVEGLEQPTAFAFAPDGRMFVSTLPGAVMIVEDGTVLPTPFVELPVNALVERGLVNVALDPSFETNGYVYVYFTFEHDATDPEGPKTNRLVRLTANGNMALPDSEVVILGTVAPDATHPSCLDYPVGTDCIPADGQSHTGGALGFSSDGTLFLGTGEASNEAPDFVAMIQLPLNLDSLAGKILRINKDGSAPPDNPFYTGNPTDPRSKVWSLGLRQPFRMAIQPTTDLPFVGDVGGANWEEINIIRPGAHYGWPCYEGDDVQADYSPLKFCEALVMGDSAVTQPLYSYPTGEEHGAIIAGVFYQGANYPSDLQGAFFFADWVRSSISVLKVDANNELVADSVEAILTEWVGRPVDFEIGPGGDVYYLNSGGQIRRIRHVGTSGGANGAGIVIVVVTASVLAVIAVGAGGWYMRRRRPAS